jgi:polyhydroxybutyrate depolymerase
MFAAGAVEALRRQGSPWLRQLAEGADERDQDHEDGRGDEREPAHPAGTSCCTLVRRAVVWGSMRSAPLSALRWTGPAVLALVGLAAACNGGSATYAPSAATPEPSAATPEPSAATPEPSAATPEPSGDPLILARPYALRVPTGYRAGTPMPLVIVLHGYGTDGVVADELFGFGTILDERGFLLALPNGVPGRNGLRFWNATDACCDFGRTGVDDVAYLRAVIDDVGARYTIDPKRIFAVGHSNGGFMAHRLACDLSDRIAAIVSLAGAVWADPSSCRPTEPISVAQLHGTADFLIRFDGGKLAGVPYPGAVETVAMWAA